MGAKDTKAKEFLTDNKRFADIFNFYLFDGSQVIKPESLEQRDTTEILSVSGRHYAAEEAKQKWRDLLKSAIIKSAGNTWYVLLGIENQSEIHYAMPIRNMNYDAMNYAAQVTEAAQKHRNKKDYTSSAEFLSGFGKEDKLRPVITLTVYWGADRWEAPRCLHDMFDENDKELLRFIDNYHLHLIIPNEITDFAKFRTSIGEVFEILKASNDKQQMKKVLHENPAFQNLEREAVSVINTFAGIQVPVNEKEEKINMCKAWDDQFEDGRAAGREQGEAIGREIGKEIGKKQGKELSIRIYKMVMSGETDNNAIAQACGCEVHEVEEIRQAFEI